MYGQHREHANYQTPTTKSLQRSGATLTSARVRPAVWAAASSSQTSNKGSKPERCFSPKSCLCIPNHQTYAVLHLYQLVKLYKDLHARSRNAMWSTAQACLCQVKHANALNLCCAKTCHPPLASGKGQGNRRPEPLEQLRCLLLEHLSPCHIASSKQA